MRRRLGWALTAAALTTMLSGPATAEPAGTVKLDAQLTESPEIRVLGASPAGVLYTVAHPDIGNSIPDNDPSGRGQVTWLKPTGAPPVMLNPPGTEYQHHLTLRGDYVFGYVLREGPPSEVVFRRIDSRETHGCLSGFPITFIEKGWVGEYQGRYQLTTIGAGSHDCSTRVLATHPNTSLKTADEHGFVVQDNGTPNRQLKYATYTDPTNLRPIAMGDQHGRPADRVQLDGDLVAWNIQNTSGGGRPPKPLGWVYRGSTSGAAPTETVVDRQITSLAITPTHTAWASDQRTATARPANLLGTIPVGGTMSTERAGINSVASAGAEFVVDAVTSQAGPHWLPDATESPVLIQSVAKMSPIASAVAVGAGRIVYADSRGTAPVTAVRRGYRPGSPPVVGAESIVTTGTQRISQDGRRTAFITTTGVWLQTEGGPIRWLSKAVSRPLLFGDVKVSGTRALWVVLNTGPHCDPVPTCPPPYPEAVYLYDARTQRTTRMPGAKNHVYGLWGNYLLVGSADGSIYRRDLSSTRVDRVKSPGRRLTSVDANGSWLGWSDCPDQYCVTTRVGYRNTLSPAAPVQAVTVESHRVRVTGGHLLYEMKARHYDPPLLMSLRLGSSSSTTVGPARGGAFDGHDETVAWVGQDMTARIAPNSSFVDRPRYLGNAIGAAAFHPGRWTVEFPISKALSACGIAINRGTTRVRAVDCATATGSAIASWDGRDSAGRLVPKGRYTWTLHGRDADGWLLWWNGSGRPITGTVTVY